MDLEPALKQAVRRITQTLHQYARDKGWKYAKNSDWSLGDYFIEVVVNVDMPRFYVTFVAKGFKGMDGHERFKDVQGYLNTNLADQPTLIRAINLVVRDPQQFDTDGSFPLGLSYEPVDDEFVELYVH